MKNKKEMSVLLLELQIITIIFTVSELGWFLVGDIKTFAIAFVLYFIPSMYIISNIVSDADAMKQIMHNKYLQKVVIVILLLISLGLIYRLIYAFDWLITSNVSSSSVIGLLIGAMIIFAGFMEVTVNRHTLRKMVIGYSIFLLVGLPIIFLCIWYYAAYGIIEINKISYTFQPLFVYVYMLSGIQLLIFFDTENSYYIFFKRSILSVIIIIIFIFGIFSLLGNALYSPDGPSEFATIYDKMTYIFEFANRDHIITIIAAMNIFHGLFLLILSTTGIKNIIKINYEYKSLNKEIKEDYEEYINHHHTKITRIFMILAIVIDLIAYKFAFGEILATSFIGLIALMILTIISCVIALRIRRNKINIFSTVSIIMVTFLCFHSMLMYM